MTDDQTKIAVVENEQKNHDRRISGLENNQRWAVVTIFALILKAAFDFIKGGVQ